MMIWAVLVIWVLVWAQVLRVAWTRRCRACGAMGPCQIGCWREDCLR